MPVSLSEPFRSWGRGDAVGGGHSIRDERWGGGQDNRQDTRPKPHKGEPERERESNRRREETPKWGQVIPILIIDRTAPLPKEESARPPPRTLTSN